MKAEDKRVCQVCGTPFPATSDFCPVCILRGAIGDDQATSELAADPAPSPSELRFGHYQVLTGEDGKPFELGRSQQTEPGTSRHQLAPLQRHG
jgi:hypothetical protein